MSLLTPSRAYRHARAYAPPRSTWWTTYGRAVRWYSAMLAGSLVPLALVLLVDTPSGVEAAQHVGIAWGVLAVTCGPVLWYLNRVRPDEY